MWWWLMVDTLIALAVVLLVLAGYAAITAVIAAFSDDARRLEDENAELRGKLESWERGYKGMT